MGKLSCNTHKKITIITEKNHSNNHIISSHCNNRRQTSTIPSPTSCKQIEVAEELHAHRHAVRLVCKQQQAAAMERQPDRRAILCQNKLQLLQKKTIRIITSSHHIAHTDPLFAMTKLLKIEDLYKYQLGIFMHKVTHSQLPQNMSSMFLRTDKIHSHKLRNQNAYFIQQIRTNTRKSTINFSGPTFWNTLPINLRQIVSIHLFKKKLKSFYRASILRMVNCTLAVITNFLIILSTFFKVELTVFFSLCWIIISIICQVVFLLIRHLYACVCMLYLYSLCCIHIYYLLLYT